MQGLTFVGLQELYLVIGSWNDKPISQKVLALFSL